MLVLAAVGRVKDSKGRSSYAGDGLNLAPFRESSELEFGSDDAFILVPSEDDSDSEAVMITLRHPKARHTQPEDLRLECDRRIQRFTEAATCQPWNPVGPTGKPGRGKLRSALAAARERTQPADADQGDAEW